LEKDGTLSPGGDFVRSPNNAAASSLSEPVSNTFTSIRRAVFKGLDSSLDTERETATQSSIDWMYASDNDTAYDSGNGSINSNDNNGSSHNGSVSSSSIHHNTNKETGSRAVYNTLRIDPTGNTRRIYVKKRDLIRQYKLQPRDLRRMDPSLSAGHRASSPSLTVKENCILINTCGVRAIIDAEKVILFESDSFWSRRFQELVIPGLQAAAERAAVEQRARRRRDKSSSKGGGRKRGDGGGAGGPEAYLSNGSNGDYGDEDSRQLPFELQMVEGALLVATGRLDDEMDIASRKVQSTLQKLPKEITPLNLEELRKVKQILVQLESRAEALRDMLEELMDDEDELIELNLSSRPVREERRRQRERERLEREATATLTKILKDPENNNNSSSNNSDGLNNNSTSTNSSTVVDNNVVYQFSGSTSISSPDRQQLASSLSSSSQVDGTDNSSSTSNGPSSSSSSQPQSATAYLEEDAQENYQDALEEMEDEDAEEEEMEEIEDLLEYYLQRAATTQSTAERLLADARDLEESIGVSLSARRFEVNRLELLLSIASFAAALGAMVASIFGMNLRSTLEMSVIGFWGTTGMIVIGSVWVFWVLFRYTKYKRIL